MKYNLFFLFAFCAFVNNYSQTFVAVIINQPPQLIVNAGDDLIMDLGEQTTLGDSPVAIGGTSPYTYSWNDGVSTFSTEQNPIVEPLISTLYTVEVTDFNNCIEYDSIYVIINNGETAINTNNVKRLSIYPNPVNKTINVELPDKKYQITLLNTNGNIIWKKSIVGSGSFPSPLENGIYLLKIESDKYSEVKIIIIKRN